MPLKKLVNSLTQSSYFKDRISILEQKGKTSFSGLAGSSSLLILASLLERFDDLLIVVSSFERAELLKAEIELFSHKKAVVFPALDTLPGEDIKPSQELIGERLAILEKWSRKEKMAVIAPVEALMSKTSRGIKNIRWSEHQTIRIDKLIKDLIEFGYRRFDIVGERGEFSVRGGLVDVFPLNFDYPLRVEFSGDEILSLRYFKPYSQRSIKKISEVSILPAREMPELPVFQYLPKDTVVVFDEKMEIERAADRHLEESGAYLSLEKIRRDIEDFPQIFFSAFLEPGQDPHFTLPQSYINKFDEIPRKAIIVSKHAARLRQEIETEVCEGSLPAGFVFEDFTIVSDCELFGEQTVLKKIKSAPLSGVADDLLADLKLKDYVVHENYGIALYQGMQMLKIDEIEQEYLVLEFSEGDKVYVPPSMAGLVEKYSSGADFKPRLSRLGTKQWLLTKSRVKKKLEDMTRELLEIYAARQKLPGFSFPADDLWQKELEGTFAYEETPDQRKAIFETKQDMEAVRPMDRLVCGDVGYGKTEVALRAAAKAASSGKQAAILVPTTILAEQHYNNFLNRFRSSPFVIQMLSRFKTKREQAEIIRSLAAGGVDIVIGTHRLLQEDVKFKDLGLFIIDEEQRFGVAHKEKLKKLKKNVDVLTLTATPIPRTLYLSLSGARDLSIINTPPLDRSPIRTYVLPWSEMVAREAILRELDRGGQVYFVHNFVETIEGAAARLRKLVPEAEISIAHGQMSEKELEKTMLEFLDQKFNVLVCTSIIESGLDIPSVNTILIDQADRFGLSQLYQIRGRVGRSAIRAYAYLFYRPEKVMTDQALARLKAIQEFTALGSGYKLAMRDLEIRGAGNLLGAEQSGHIMEVGFDLYCELLDEAVREIKGIEELSPREIEIDLKIEAFIPPHYIPDERQRIAVYRRMNLLSSGEEVDEMKKELKDRFGNIPAKLEKLFEILCLRVKARKFGVKSIKEAKGKILIEKLSGRRKKIEIGGRDKIKLAEQSIAG